MSWWARAITGLLNYHKIPSDLLLAAAIQRNMLHFMKTDA